MKRTLKFLILLILLAIPCTAWAVAPALIGGKTSMGSTAPLLFDDADTGAGTDYMPVCMAAYPAAGGHQKVDAAHPLPSVDTAAGALLGTIDTDVGLMSGYLFFP